MLALLLLLSQGRGDWLDALEQGDYRLAWDASAGVTDALERSRAETRILYEAGDPASALIAARRGLALEGQQLELLFYSAGATLWLGEAGAARTSVEALRAAVATAPLAAEERAAWQRTAASFASQVESLAAGEADRTRAVAVARSGALLGLLAALVALLLLARTLGRTRSGAPH